MVADGFISFKLHGYKHKKPLIGDIITMINRLRLEINHERVHENANVIDVNIKTY